SAFRNGARCPAGTTVGGHRQGGTVSPLRRVALSTSLATVAGAALVAPTALAGMHPKLAARLAGMGEHGVVNLTVDAKAKKVCWVFDVPTKGITGASIRTGAKGVVLAQLGTTYTKKGCAAAPEMALEHLETAP